MSGQLLAFLLISLAIMGFGVAWGLDWRDDRRDKRRRLRDEKFAAEYYIQKLTQDAVAKMLDEARRQQ